MRSCGLLILLKASALLFLPLGAWPVPVWSQVTIEEITLLDIPLVAIEISGNRVTQEEIILREMETAIGMPTSREQLRRDHLRVKGLNLFSRVEFYLTNRSQGPVLLIQVTELWYIVPLPYWNFKEQNPDELIYGFRYYQHNFRGRDETLSLDFYNGADRGYRFLHVNPWMKGTPQISRAVELYQVTRTSMREEVSDLEERATQIGLQVGRRWNIRWTNFIGMRFRLTKGVNPLQLASGNLIDHTLDLSIGSIWDSRDLATFPMEGFYVQGRASHGWLVQTPKEYLRYYLDARGYLPVVPQLSLASRLQWLTSVGSVAPYDWVYLQASGPIRSPGISDVGKNYYQATLEARCELSRLHYFTWRKAPFFPQYFRNLEYGLAAELFMEAGDAYNRSRESGISALNVGYGAGIMLRLAYVGVLRLESSLNPKYSIKEANFAIRSRISF